MLAFDQDGNEIKPGLQSVDKQPKRSSMEIALSGMQRLMDDPDLRMSPEEAAGVMGSLWHESGGFKQMQEIKPVAGRGGYGWAQWTGPRRRQFEEFVRSNNLDPASDEANFQFLKHELTKTQEGRVLAPLKQAQSEAEASDTFTKVFERPGVPALSQRRRNARNIMLAFNGGGTVPEQTSDAGFKYFTDEDAAQVQFAEPNGMVEPQVTPPQPEPTLMERGQQFITDAGNAIQDVGYNIAMTPADKNPMNPGNLAGAAKAGGYGLAEGAAGVMQAGLEGTHRYLTGPVTNALGVPDPMLYSAQQYGLARRKMKEAGDKALPQTGNPTLDAVYSGVQSVSQNAFPLVAGLLTGQPEIALAGLSGAVAGQEYGKARDLGKGFEESLVYGGTQAGIEYLTERLPVGKLFNDIKADTALWKTIGRQVATEIPGEEAATVLQSIEEKAALHPEKTWSQLADELPGQMYQTAIATIVAAGAQSAIGHTVQKTADRIAESSKLQTLMADPEFRDIMTNEVDPKLKGLEKGRAAKAIWAQRQALKGLTDKPDDTTISSTGIPGETNAQNTDVSSQGNDAPGREGDQVAAQAPRQGGEGGIQPADTASVDPLAQGIDAAQGPQIAPEIRQAPDGQFQLVDTNTGTVISQHLTDVDAFEALDQLNADLRETETPATTETPNGQSNVSAASVGEIQTGSQPEAGTVLPESLDGSAQLQGAGQETQPQGHHGLNLPAGGQGIPGTTGATNATDTQGSAGAQVGGTAAGSQGVAGGEQRPAVPAGNAGGTGVGGQLNGSAQQSTATRGELGGQPDDARTLEPITESSFPIYFPKSVRTALATTQPKVDRADVDGQTWEMEDRDVTLKIHPGAAKTLKGKLEKDSTWILTDAGNESIWSKDVSGDGAEVMTIRMPSKASQLGVVRVQHIRQQAAAKVPAAIGKKAGVKVFVRASHGGEDFGVVPELQSALKPGSTHVSAPIRMEEGGGFGNNHIAPERIAQFQENGYASPAELLQDVSENYTHVFEQPNGRLLLVKRNGRAKYAAVELQDNGAYYGATTMFLEDASPKGKPYENRGGGRLLWSRAEAAPSGSGAEFPSADNMAGPAPADALESSLEQSIGQGEPLSNSVAPTASRFAAPGVMDGISDLVSQAGWAQKGGHLYRDANGKPNRTTWLPKQDWWMERPDGTTQKDFEETLRRLQTGSQLAPKHEKIADFLYDLQTISLPVEDVQNTGYDELDPALADEVDELIERAMRELGTETTNAIVEAASKNAVGRSPTVYLMGIKYGIQRAFDQRQSGASGTADETQPGGPGQGDESSRQDAEEPGRPDTQGADLLPAATAADRAESDRQALAEAQKEQQRKSNATQAPAADDGLFAQDNRQNELRFSLRPDEQQQRIRRLNRGIDAHNRRYAGGDPGDARSRVELAAAEDVPAARRIEWKLASAIAAVFKHNLIPVRGEAGGRLNFDGVVDPNGDPSSIFITVDSSSPISRVVAHELLHGLRLNAPRIYDNLVKTLRQLYDADALVEYVNGRNYGGELTDKNEEEWVADFVSNVIHSPDALVKVAFAMNRNKAGSGFNFLRRVQGLVERIKQGLAGTPLGANKIIAKSDLQKAEDAVIEALAQYAAHQEKGAQPSGPLKFSNRAKEKTERIADADYRVLRRDDNNLLPVEQKVFDDFLASRPDGKELLQRLQEHRGTPWAQQAIEGIFVRQAIKEYAAGRTPEFQSSFDNKAVTKAREFVSRLGEEGIFAYLDSTNYVGDAAKPINNISSSFINCNPSKDCAKYCYATKGHYKFAPAVVKSEMVTMAIELDPARVAQRAASEYKATAEFANNKALRIFDKGDGNQAWIPFIRQMNVRGVRIHVFSKVPDFLRQVPDMNLKLLSVDNSNMEMADQNPDLPVAFVYSGGINQVDMLAKLAARGQIQVVLPVKLGQKLLDKQQVTMLKQTVKGIGKYLCPIDAGVKEIGPNSDRSKWNCTKCDINGGLGCYHGKVTAAVLNSQEAKPKSGPEIAREILEVRAEIARFTAAGKSGNGGTGGPVADVRRDDARGVQSLLQKVDRLMGQLLEQYEPDAETRANLESDGGTDQEGADNEALSGNSGRADLKFSNRTPKSLRDLVTLHNLTEENLAHADAMGGMPVPSIGISKVDSPFSGFGDITLIGPKDLIDPEKGVPVFDRDAWTSRFPEMNYKKVKAAKADAFYERMKPARSMADDGGAFVSELWDRVRNASKPSPDRVAELFTRYDAPRLLYAKEVLGKHIKVPTRPYSPTFSASADPAVRSFFLKNQDAIWGNDSVAPESAERARKELARLVGDAIDQAAEAKGGNVEVRKKLNREGLFTESGELQGRYLQSLERDIPKIGTRVEDGAALRERVRKAVPDNDPAYRKWVFEQVEALFEPPTMTLRGRQVEPTLDNLVDAMTIGATQGAEKSMTFSAGKTMAHLGKRFKSIAEIQAARDQVVDEEREQESKRTADKLLFDYRDQVIQFFTRKDYRGNIDTWAGMDASMEALAKAGKLADTDGNIRLALQKAGFKGVDAKTIDMARQSINAMRNVATNYFEAKPQRAVKLNEFRGAVAPKSLSPDAMAILEKNGLTVELYGNGDGAREKAIAKLAKRLDKPNKDLLFSNKRQTAQQEYEGVVARYKGTDQWLKAPNGKPTNLTEHQWVQVRTNSFKAWFGPAIESVAADLLVTYNPSRGGGKVFDDVAGAIKQSQILDGVIASIPIDMMNDLGGQEGATKMLLHNPSVFVDIASTGKTDSDVVARLSRFFGSTESIVAVARAKLALADTTSPDTEGSAALHALQNNLVFIWARLTNSGSNSSGSGSASVNQPYLHALALAGIGAEPSSAFNLVRGNLKFNSAAYARNLHHEDYSLAQQNMLAIAEHSKVVDENGEPKVVYHGTKQGGFTVLDPDKGDGHRSPMVFTAATRNTSRSYSGSGTEIDMGMPPDDVPSLEKFGYQFDDTEDGVDLWDPNGNLIGTFKSFDVAIQEGMEDFKNYGDDYRENDERGIYSLFLNIRNPYEEHFEGANWDGDRSGQYIVVDEEGNPASGFFDNEDDAQREAELIGEGATVEPAPDHYDTTNSVAEAAKRYGSDGAIIRQVVDDGGQGGYVEADDVFVIFDAKQAKSATQNTGEFGPSMDLRFSNKRNVLGQPALATWTMPDDSKLERWTYLLQDKHIDTKRVVERLKTRVADAWDPYLKETLYHGRAAKDVDDFKVSEVRPLLQAMSTRGITIGELETFLWNRHAPEANAQIAKINEAYPDGGSGINTQDAIDYLANLPAGKRTDLEALAAQIDAITAGTRRLLVESGLETQDTIDAWEATYSDYIPLQRETDDLAQKGMGTGQGFSTKGSASKRRTGSGRAVEDILANVMMQRERAITRAEKNKVGLALYGLAIQNPNPEFWYPVNPDAVKNPAKVAQELVNLGMLDTDLAGIIQEPTVAQINPRTGLVEYVINPLLRNRDNVLAVRIKGKDRFLFFSTENERAIRMAQSLKNLDAPELDAAMSVFRAASRWFSMVNTQYNPIFGAVNLTRDVQAGMLNLSTTPIAGKQIEVAALIKPALLGIWGDLRADRKGQPRKSSPMSKLWEEFQSVGGKTGYREMFATAGDRAKALEDELKMIQEGTAKRMTRRFFGLLSDYNETLENAVRLAAYKVGVDSGMSKERSAAMAKELTVNFNRKGQKATTYGALWAFFNAAVQGTARMAETMRGPAGGKIFYGGLLAGALQAVMMAAAGYDDDEPPEFVRERSFVIPLDWSNNLGGPDLDGKYFSFPMPLGFHVIPTAGRVMVESMMNPKETGNKMLGLLGTLLEAFNPIGSAGLSFQTLAPTIADPLVALGENRDAFGKEIAKKDRSQTNPTPGFTRAKDTASWFSKQLSHAINSFFGGTDYVPGKWSPTPDQIDYVLGQATGGVGREVMKIEQAASSWMSGEELPPYKYPLGVGRFVGDTKSQAADANRFYANITKLNELENEIKGRAKDGKDVAGFLRSNPLATLVPAGNQTERAVTELRSRKRKLVEQKAPKATIKALEGQIAAQMKALNDRVRSVSRPPRG